MDLLGCLQSLLMGGKVYFNFKSRNSLSLDGKLPHGERPESMDLLGCLQSLLMGGEVLADGAGLLGPQIQRLVLLSGVELPQVVLLLLVHHDVNTGNGFPDDPDLRELGGGATSHLGHTELPPTRSTPSRRSSRPPTSTTPPLRPSPPRLLSPPTPPL